MSKRPNLLLITADQLRHDCVGYSGAYPVRTPNLDSLAATSTAFEHAYSVLPVCAPSRQSLLHGRRPETFGALWNYSGALPIAALSPNDYAWTRTLANNGYAMAYLGKWGVNPEHGPTEYGYESYVSEKDYESFAAERYPGVAIANGYFGERNTVPLEDSETHWFAARAIETLGRLQEDGRPWHMALHFSQPHLPCRPSDPYAGMYDPAEIPEWEGFRETFRNKPYIQRQQLLSWGVEDFGWAEWAPIVARYYGIISQLDDAIGRVLQAVGQLGADRDTIVVFTADHGDMCGSHGMMDKHYILYDDVVRVPLLIRLPGTSQGQVRQEFVYNFLDLAPTLLDVLSLRAFDPGNLQGVSLVPLLADGQPNEWRDAVVSTYNGQQFGLYTQRMIRTAQWKYIWNPTDVDELYELRTDPGELVNRMGEPGLNDLVIDLRRRLYERLSDDGDAIVANEWMRHQLLDGAKLSSCKPKDFQG
ncbi:sulfatase-like hydrolase/transferase [Cohnella nanjingensis]|uniref:Sulfatase-like hydrolase/transferase n=1 Tax=Cohnella nanjingensis TaxID=1387779 RepID=A0A7X0RNN1_9BACL|nr:sulfatase-like hydrolase/transferase [Cohnella nanjingensis]MBB6669409.1 sulfatase-like hydrolase/transferase [Cohnella nanjingensis]